MRVVLFAAVLAFSAGQTPAEPPASVRRPNLQVLKTIPESQLFPVMNALSDSLGVRCDYCHVRINPDPTKTWSLAGGWVWDRDDKPAKAVARDMMRMVLDINQRQVLNGTKITCFTCHRGSTTPARFPPLPPRDFATMVAPAVRPLPPADEVWSAYIRSVGGEAAANGFSSTVMSATDERSEGRQGSIEVTFKGADRMRVTLQVPPDGPVSQALNQEAGWVASGDTIRPLRPEEVARVRRGSVRYGVIKLARPADLRITGIERVGDREAYVAESEVNAPRRTAWFFDTETGLLLRERTTTETELLPLQEQIDYEDYRRVDGVTLPFRTRSSDGSPFSTSVRRWTIRHNVAVDDAVFRMPVKGEPAPASPAAVAAPAAQTPPQTAGERYTSVRELRDVPAAQIIPAMAFIANSLGVTCSHCHTSEWASDQKPEKAKARAMIRMQRAINAEQYGGRQVVTCETCHNGRIVPVATPAVENAGWNKQPAAPAAPLPDAKTILDRNAAAMGGDAAFARLQNRLVQGTVTRNNGRVAPASAPFELSQSKPQSARLTTELSHPAEADAEVIASFVKPMLLRTAYRDPRAVARERIRGRDAIAIDATTSGGATHRLWFDAATHLLLRRSDEIATPLGKLPEQYDFDAYRRVDGVMVPFVLQWSRADYQVTFAVGSVRHNVPDRR